MHNVKHLTELPARAGQSVLTRILMQERENALLRADAASGEEALRQAKVGECAARAEAEALLLEVVRLCLLCVAVEAPAHETAEAVAAQLSQSAEEEEAAAHTFAAAAHHERVAFFARCHNCAVDDAGVRRLEDVECALAEAEAVAATEKAEILRLEQERAELEQRTELAMLQYARDLFNVYMK